MIAAILDRQAENHRGDSLFARGWWNGTGWAYTILGPMWIVIAAFTTWWFLGFAVTWTLFGLVVLLVQHRAHGNTWVRRNS